MKSKQVLIAFCILIFTTACSVSPTIRSSANNAVDFNQYTTFGFFDPLDTDTRYESLTSQYLKQATRVEMTRRGFVFTQDNPDLLINFHGHTENKQTIHQFPSSGYSAGYYEYRGHLYYDAFINTRTFIDDYQQGTLSIDLVDNKLKKMVWQGVAVGRVTQEKLKNLQSTLQQTISEIFTQFPRPITP